MMVWCTTEPVIRTRPFRNSKCRQHWMPPSEEPHLLLFEDLSWSPPTYCTGGGYFLTWIERAEQTQKQKTDISSFADILPYILRKSLFTQLQWKRALALTEVYQNIMNQVHVFIRGHYWKKQRSRAKNKNTRYRKSRPQPSHQDCFLSLD